jgi:putative spermidine/putrescine transport system ATP-binding protein
MIKNPEGNSVELYRCPLGYGSSIVVRDFCLKIEKGELLTILGPSGCGKSTILKSIAGFIRPVEGRIHVNSIDITDVPSYKRDIGMVFQNLALFPHMTVFENIAFPLRRRHLHKREINNKVTSVIETVGLEDCAQRYPRQLSGGEQQRVALARVLVFNPTLLLLDEPLSSLDKKLKNEIELEIKRLHRSLKSTIIYVTHDQTEALTVSDRIAVMSEGKLEQVGRADEIYENPGSKFVAGFVGEINCLMGQIITVKSLTATIGLRDLQVISTSESCLRGNPLQDGDSVCAFIRPERVFFTTEGNMPANKFGGRVIDVIFLGENIKYLVQIGNETLIKMSRPAKENMTFSKGDNVKIGWEAKDTKILIS